MVRKAIQTGLSLMALIANAAHAADSLEEKNWGLQSAGGISASLAWNQMKAKGDCSKSGVVVAVIDTGIDAEHPALRGSLWENPKEKNGKPGVDDDGDGYIDDINGWDFTRNSGKLIDKHGHGTHIAGIISASDKAPGGLKGVCPGVKIMALRYYDENANGTENLRNTIKAIEFAISHGASIINYSGGGAEFSNAEYQALKKAEAKGILVVAAAGNERSNADKEFYFPAAYSLRNILSVTAVDPEGNILSSANWGVKKVHVAAPGSSILSSIPGGSYGYMSGTSQATAFVSGIAAMLLTENRGLNFMKLRGLIEDSVMKYPKLATKAKAGGRVNAASAIAKLSSRSRALSSAAR